MIYESQNQQPAVNVYPNSNGYGMSGHRYYDDEMGSAVHELERMMNSEGNPEKRMALQRILDDLRMR